MVVFGGDDYFGSFVNRYLAIITCDDGDMMCSDLVSSWITMLVGFLLGVSIECQFLIHRCYR